MYQWDDYADEHTLETPVVAVSAQDAGQAGLTPRTGGIYLPY